NADGTKFCRGCGADISNALAAVGPGGTAPQARAVAEKHIELYSAGVRGLMLGSGFLILAALAFVLSSRGLTFSLFALAFAFVCLATGISRLVHARGLRALDHADPHTSDHVLHSGQMDYITPPGSIYDT